MVPKKQSEQPKVSNKIRFVMLEADLSDGNLAELTQAITNALKPQAPVIKYIAGHQPRALSSESDSGSPTSEVSEDLLVETEESDLEASETPRVSKPRPPKNFKQPNYVELDWTGNGGPTFKEFAKQKDPKNRARKYLVAAFWLKEFGGCPSVNADKIYSCFKTAGWSVAFKDWRASFDSLTYNDHFRRVGVGEFSITTLGEGMLQTAED